VLVEHAGHVLQDDVGLALVLAEEAAAVFLAGDLVLGGVGPELGDGAENAAVRGRPTRAEPLRMRNAEVP